VGKKKKKEDETTLEKKKGGKGEGSATPCNSRKAKWKRGKKKGPRKMRGGKRGRLRDLKEKKKVLGHWKKRGPHTWYVQKGGKKEGGKSVVVNPSGERKERKCVYPTEKNRVAFRRGSSKKISGKRKERGGVGRWGRKKGVKPCPSEHWRESEKKRKKRTVPVFFGEEGLSWACSVEKKKKKNPEPEWMKKKGKK